MATSLQPPFDLAQLLRLQAAGKAAPGRTQRTRFSRAPDSVFGVVTAGTGRSSNQFFERRSKSLFRSLRSAFDSRDRLRAFRCGALFNLRLSQACFRRAEFAAATARGLHLLCRTMSEDKFAGFARPHVSKLSDLAQGTRHYGDGVVLAQRARRLYRADSAGSGANGQ